MRLGNDIVDRCATEGHNPRFMDRILNPTEKARHAAWSLDEPRVWIYWACKEAAYKALRQSLDIPFHHREFIIAADLESLSWHDRVLRLRVRQDGDAIFALATDGDPDTCRSSIASFPTEPHPSVHSEKARALVLDLAAVHLKLPREELTIVAENRIPKIGQKGQTLPYALSLTHHGRYVAASLAVP